MNSEITGNCWKCGQGLTPADYGREATCPGCGRPTRVCRNCRHFAPGRPNDCIEAIAEPVADKERANFCELFEPRRQDAAASASPQDLLARAEDLFK